MPKNMQAAVLGDIHANAPALEAVLAAVSRKKIEYLILTGDYVGYYYWPKKIIDLLEPWPKVAVRGNHEDLLKDAVSSLPVQDRIAKKYGSGMQAAIEQLDAHELELLTSLPRWTKQKYNEHNIFVGHGSCQDTNEYIYPDADRESLEQFANLGCKWVFLGHTHYKMNLRFGDVNIVNPGSVGQPRDRKPGAAWASVDFEQSRVEFHTESYDIKSVARQARRRDPNHPYLSKVLTRQ